tara:strand:- start:266 stop:487 length:222 start_codon:yes stop_codon:yes gene_type:complete
MKKAWVFILKVGGKQRVELYGNLTELKMKENKALEILRTPTMDSFRKLVKLKYVNDFFHIEKLEVKRSKHNTK